MVEHGVGVGLCLPVVIEYVHGGDVARFVHGGVYAVCEAAVLRQVICKAYAALHRGEHVHFILRHFLDEPGGSRVESSAPEHNLAGCA